MAIQQAYDLFLFGHVIRLAKVPYTLKNVSTKFSVAKLPAIYFFVSDYVIYYIGSSRSLQTRLIRHHERTTLRKDWPGLISVDVHYALFISAEYHQYRYALETALIRRYKPLLNTVRAKLGSLQDIQLAYTQFRERYIPMLG